MHQRSRSVLRCLAAASAIVSVAACTSDSADPIDVPGAGSTPVTIGSATVVESADTASTIPETPSTPTPTPTPAPAPTEPTTEPTPATTAAATTSPPVGAPTTAPPPATTIPEPEPIDDRLRPGDERPEVGIAQLKLIVLGYLPQGSGTGVFDDATEDAVRRFQGDYGLFVDGIVGPQTNRSLTAAAESVNVEE